MDWLNFRIRKHFVLYSGIFLLILVFAVGLLAPILTPQNPLRINPVEGRLLRPTNEHILGTDITGRDVFSRLLFSIRLAYLGGLGAVLITAILGTLLGIYAGYYMGWIDAIIMRLIDVWLSLPGLLSLLVIIALIGRGFIESLVAVSLAGIPSVTRYVRGLTIQEKSQSYIEAARALGGSGIYISIRHIIPNMLPSLSTLLASHFGWVILTMGSLSYMGFGIQPPIPDLGQLINDGQKYSLTAWWLLIGPISVLWLTMLGANLISDGISER